MGQDVAGSLDAPGSRAGTGPAGTGSGLDGFGLNRFLTRLTPVLPCTEV